MSDTQVGKQCLVHSNAQHIQVRKDFLDLCAYDKNDYNKGTRASGKIIRDEPNQECMAKLLRLLETLTDHRKFQWQHHNEELIAKKKLPLKEPAEYRIELAYSTLDRLLYNTCGESTIRNSMAVLIQRGYVIRYLKNNASTPFYVLNISLLQPLLQNQTTDEEPFEEGVLNVTPSDPDVSLGDDKVLNVTPRVMNTTPNNIESNTSRDIAPNTQRERGASKQTTKPTPVQSIFSAEEKQLLDWYAQLKTGHKTKPEKAKEILPDLLQHIHSFERMKEEHDNAAKKLKEEGKTDGTVYLATIRYYMLARLKERPAQQEQEDPNEMIVWTRYRTYEDFSASDDLWFLFEEMTVAEANIHGLAERGRMGTRTEYLIREKLDHSDNETQHLLINAWINERTSARA